VFKFTPCQISIFTCVFLKHIWSQYHQSDYFKLYQPHTPNGGSVVTGK